MNPSFRVEIDDVAMDISRFFSIILAIEPFPERQAFRDLVMDVDLQPE